MNKSIFIEQNKAFLEGFSKTTVLQKWSYEKVLFSIKRILKCTQKIYYVSLKGNAKHAKKNGRITLVAINTE